MLAPCGKAVNAAVQVFEKQTSAESGRQGLDLLRRFLHEQQIGMMRFMSATTSVTAAPVLQRKFQLMTLNRQSPDRLKSLANN
jgi:hypothetical protein